jgi:hypothetical protein
VIKCRVCAAENEAEAAFCGVCGSRLEAEAPDSTAVEPKPATPEPKPIAPVLLDPTPGATPEPRPEPTFYPKPEPPRPPPPKPTTPTPNSFPCPVCGTINEPSRTFCKKCASELRPAPPVKKPLVSRAFLVRFLVSAFVGMVVVIGGAEILSRLPLGGAAGASPIPLSLVSDDGVQTDVGLQPADPQPLAPLPDTATLQLTSYEAPATEAPGETAAPTRPRWWSDGIPRIPAISQFDGGPLQGVNCVMASGAMLARLGYGVVTTGSQLRALSGDPEGPTSFLDLQRAVYKGWGIRFSMGAASALQLRALLFAGAGAEVVVDYGEVPVDIRLQASFTGNHAIYLDAFSPTGLNGKAAYYVMDPIGHTWQGYKGGWWPAEAVERAAMAFGNGRIATMWTFAGGRVPFVHPVLPRSAYPSDTPVVTPGPSDTPAPGQTFGPGGIDPMPFSDLPLDVDTTNGDPPPDQPKFPRYDFLKDAFFMSAGTDSTRCTTKPIPPDCPIGIVGIIGTLNLATPPPIDLKLLYANAISFGTYQIIFESPLEGDRSLLFWDTSGGTYEKATVESGLLSGKEVSIATITLDPAKDYSFMATAADGDVRAISSVGTLTVK